MSAQRRLPERLPPADSPNVLFQSFRTNHALRELMVGVFKGTGITGDEYGVLGVIHFFPERTPTELAQVLGIPPTTISRYVNRFVDTRLVVRVPNPADGRSYLLRPTAKGSRIVQKIAPRIGDIVEQLRAVSERPLEDITAALIALEDAAKSVVADRELATKR